MTQDDSPFEMVERHGVGNILRLLWAYMLHRGSERLASRARRVLARATTFEVSRREVPTLRDVNHPDVISPAAVHFTEEQYASDAAPFAWTNGGSHDDALTLKRPVRIGPAPLPARRVHEEARPSEERPEPWFRALQVAHRSALIAREGSSRLEYGHAPPPQVNFSAEGSSSKPNAPHDAHETATEDFDVLEADPLDEERPRLKLENEESMIASEIAASLDLRHDMPAVVDQEPAVSRAEMGLERREEDVRLIMTEDEGRSIEESLTSLLNDPVPPEQRPALPQEPQAWHDADQRAGVPDVSPEADLFDSCISALPHAISSTASACTEWTGGEGMWPSLPEESRYAPVDRGLERYQREQRRWDEQRGNL